MFARAAIFFGLASAALFANATPLTAPIVGEVSVGGVVDTGISVAGGVVGEVEGIAGGLLKRDAAAGV